MRWAVAVMLLGACGDHAGAGSDLAMSVHDLASASDAAESADLTPASAGDLAGADMVQASGTDLAHAQPDMVSTCGGDGQVCCQAAFPYCNDASLMCHLNTCTSCGGMTQPCCGGDADHVGGTCYTGTCLDRTHAFFGKCY